MTKTILALGICVVLLLVVLAFLEIVSFVVAGFLLAAVIGVVGWILNYSSKSAK
jgi:hypothetical protein